MVIIDPISILLHHPDVAYNMTIRKPQTAGQWQLWYFAAKDAGVAHTLGRRFFWFENILWKEDIADRRATVFLSERDLLVDTSQVRAYLLGVDAYSDSNPKHLTTNGNGKVVDNKTKGRVSVVWCNGLDHGQVFETRQWRGRLLDEVNKVSIRKTIA
jgi:hypothetical protein